VDKIFFKVFEQNYNLYRVVVTIDLVQICVAMFAGFVVGMEELAVKLKGSSMNEELLV